LLVTVPGVEDVIAANLLADLPALGQLNRGQAAKLVGVAPLNRDSGQYRGKRMIGGGRASVRQILFTATLVAMRWNPVIKRHYNHLLENGKSKMVALTACMRKLLLILNAMIKTNSLGIPRLSLDFQDSRCCAMWQWDQRYCSMVALE
jgi:transposase